MEARQRLLEIRRIFHEAIEKEARYYLSNQESRITFFNIKGRMIFLHKYELIGDGEGGNELVSQIEGRNTFNEAPTFIIKGDCYGATNFWLYLERPDIEHDDESYFVKEREQKTIYRLDSETMLESKEFKKVFLKMMEDIAPERLDEVRRLLA